MKETKKSSAIDAEDLFKSYGTPVPVPSSKPTTNALELEL